MRYTQTDKKEISEGIHKLWLKMEAAIKKGDGDGYSKLQASRSLLLIKLDSMNNVKENHIAVNSYKLPNNNYLK